MDAVDHSWHVLAIIDVRRFWIENLQKYKKIFSCVSYCSIKMSIGVSLAIWDHTVLPTTWHKWLTYPRGIESWVDLRKVHTLSLNTSVVIITVALHPAWLVLGWVTNHFSILATQISST